MVGVWTLRERVRILISPAVLGVLIELLLDISFSGLTSRRTNGGLRGPLVFGKQVI